MKKLFITLLLVTCYILSYGQFGGSPTPLGNINNIVIPAGGLSPVLMFQLPRYSDTTAANTAGKTGHYVASEIYTTSDGNVWIRNVVMTAWVNQSGGGLWKDSLGLITTTLDSGVVINGNVKSTTETTNSINLLPQSTATPPPISGNNIFDSSGLNYRDKFGTTLRISKSHITPGVTQSIYPQNKTYTLGDSAYTPNKEGRLLYHKSWFTGLGDFNVVTPSGATTSVYPDSSIVLTGDVGAFTHYITLTAVPPNNEQDYVFSITGVPDSINTTSYGFSLAQQSTNVTDAFTNHWEVDYRSNAVRFYNNTTNISTWIYPFVINSKDVIRFIVQRIGIYYSATLIDVTQNRSFTANTVFNIGITHGAVNMANTNNFAIFNLGGHTSFRDICIRSLCTMTPYIAFLGDSKTFGYLTGGDLTNSFPYQCRSLGSYDVFAGSGDKTVELVTDTSYIGAFHPKYAVIDIGCNDLRRGISSAVWQANLIAINGWAKRNNIIIIWMLPTPEISTFDQSALKSFIQSQFAGEPMIDPSVGWIESVYLAADSIHPNAAGQAFKANLVINSGFIPKDITSAPQPLYDYVPLTSTQVVTSDSLGNTPYYLLGIRRGTVGNNSAFNDINGANIGDFFIRTGRLNELDTSKNLYVSNQSHGSIAFTTSNAGTNTTDSIRLFIQRHSGTVSIGMRADTSTHRFLSLKTNGINQGVQFAPMLTSVANTFMFSPLVENGTMVTDTGTAAFQPPTLSLSYKGIKINTLMTDTANRSRVNGEIPIFNTTTGYYTQATLTAGPNTVITNSAGSVTISSLPSRSDTLKAQSGAVSTVSTFTPTTTGLFNVGGMVNVTGGSLDILQVQISYKDEQGNVQTISLGAGINTTLVATSLPVTTIWAQAGTAIVTKTTLTTGTGTITYDIGTYIEQKK